MASERAETFLECLWNLVIRNRMAAGPSGSPFTSAEAHALVNLVVHSSLTVNEVSSFIQHDQAATSRLLGRLAEQGYVEKTPNPQDSRSTVVSVSQKTKDLFSVLEADYNQRSEKIYAALTPSERKMLFDGFDKIGDYKGVPPSPSLRPDEHPSRPPIRRYTVAIGFLGRGLLDTSLSSSLWMILESIKRLPPEDCTPAQMSDLLGVTRSTMTYSLKSLTKLKAIKRHADEADNRSYRLTLTSQGDELREQIKDAADAFLQGAFGHRSNDEQEAFLEIYLRIIGGAVEAQAKTQADTNRPRKSQAASTIGDPLLTIELIQASTPEERQAARAFALNILVSSNLAHRAPAAIADEASTVFTAKISNQIVGFAQVGKTPDKQVELLLCEPLLAGVLGGALHLAVGGSEATTKNDLLSNCIFGAN
jgi:DNA-binding MarR family transcriptional regulator